MKRNSRRPRLWVSLLVYPAAVVSLLVALAGAVMWVRSYYVAERWGWGTVAPDGNDMRLDDVSIWSAQGGVAMFREEYWNLMNTRSGWPVYHLTDAMTMYPYIAVVAGLPERRWKLGGFAWKRSEVTAETRTLGTQYIGPSVVDYGDRSVSISVVVPWWSFFAIGMVLPLLAARRMVLTRRWRRRNRAGLCAVCGYDLRVTPERCPECGAVPASA